MKELKFRTPVICQNGHKGMWYWHIEDYGIGTVKHDGVIANRCDCPKQALGEGYIKNGDDQQFIGKLDKYGNAIFESDIIHVKWVTKDEDYNWGYYIVKFGEGANVGGGDSSSYFYGYYLEKFNGEQHTDLLIEPDTYSIEVIGNVYENPELWES